MEDIEVIIEDESGLEKLQVIISSEEQILVDADAMAHFDSVDSLYSLVVYISLNLGFFKQYINNL